MCFYFVHSVLFIKSTRTEYLNTCMKNLNYRKVLYYTAYLPVHLTMFELRFDQLYKNVIRYDCCEIQCAGRILENEGHLH